MFFKYSSRLKWRGGLYHGFGWEQKYCILSRLWPVIKTKTFTFWGSNYSNSWSKICSVMSKAAWRWKWPNLARMLIQMLTHTQTHRQTHKQANVICIAKGYPKKWKRKKEKKEKKSRGALLDSACGCCKNVATHYINRLICYSAFTYSSFR